MRKILFAGLVALAPYCLFAQATKTAGSTSPVFVTAVEGVKEYKLANGLRVLLVPDAANSNVVVNIVYQVGSRHEGYGETGMAHLLEHMLFKGSKKFSNIKQTIADKGAIANGTTWYDRTNYYEVLPATDSNLVWALEMEADRMVNSLMKKEELQKEFSVVRNEFESGENYPDGILQERVLSTMYLWHNYGKSTIGSKEDIERVPMDNLKAFYKKYYQPDNATLVIGGKFDEKKTLEQVARFFGRIPKPSRVIQPAYTVEPAQDGARFVELKRNGDMQYVGLGYHTPSYSDKDYVANDAVIAILTNDPSGIFYKALVEKKIATKVSGYSLALYDPGFTYFSVDVPLDKSAEEARTALLSTADNLANTPITEEDLQRAKNTLNKQVSNLQNNTLGFCINLTEIIGAGDWRLFYVYRDRLEKLTLADVQAALKKYYIPSNKTVGLFIPDKNAQRAVVNETADISALVKDYKGKATTVQTETFEASIPNIKKNTEYGKLANGFRYALLKKPTKGDKIFGNLNLRIGNESSLMNKDMISSLTARMLKNGTTSKTKKEINDLLDKWKTSINVYGGGSQVTASINTDKEHIDSALVLLADILLHPSFDKNEFDKMKLDIKGEYESFRSDPDYLAYNALAKKISQYPKGHPLYPQSTEESLAELEQVSLDDIRKFYAEFYGAGNGVASFVGNINKEAIKTALAASLSNFNAKQPYAEVAPKYFDVNGSTETIQVPDKKNASLYGAINLQLKETDADYPALEIANELLGGGAFLSSRIPQRLRESEGMSYGAGSFLDISYKYAASSWGMYAIFNPLYKERLDSALHDEIKKALQGGFKEDEFKKSVASWMQQRKTSLGLDNAIVSMLNTYQKREIDLGYYTSLEERVQKLTVKDVNEVLRKYMNENKLVLVYAGDFKKK
jgi:zinc protease